MTEGSIAADGVGWVSSVTVDSIDPDRLSHFWSHLLGLEVGKRQGRFVILQRPSAAAPELVFQAVPESKHGKVRIHLDIEVPDLAIAVQRVRELGGFEVTEVHENGSSWRVMRDPEGNEFCLIPMTGGNA